MALGDVDELNGAIGVAREYCVQAGNGVEPWLAEIQSRLMDVGAAVATPLTSASKHKIARAKFPEKLHEVLEAHIDSMDDELPALKNFILPVSSFLVLSVKTHVA